MSAIETKKIIVKQLILQFLENLLMYLKENVNHERPRNKSYLYLENDTLNTLLKYIIIQMNKNNENTSFSLDEEHYPVKELHELQEQIDDLLEKNEQEFETLIALLENKLS